MDNKITLKGVVTKVESSKRLYDAFGVPSRTKYQAQLQVEGSIWTLDLDKVVVPKDTADTAPVAVSITFPEGWEVA
jgi:hypothetical protein